METLNIRGIPLEVHTAGSGPPLLFLHAEQFILQARPFLDALARTHRVIAPRHPGFGTAQLPPDFRTVDDIAYLYLDLAEKLGLENAVLAGASLGGWIALEMCVRNHARFAKLALVSPVGVKLSGREERDFADIFYLPDPEAMAAAFADPARFAPSYEALPVADVEQLAREKQALAYYAWRPYLHKPGLERWLHRLALPTLVVCGEQDRFAAPEYGRKLAERLPDARVTMISGAGHYPQIERADAVAKAISAF